MIYMLEFLGLLAIALMLASSRFLIELLESIFPADEPHRGPAARYGLRSNFNESSNERREMRNEIRRMTSLLEAHRPSSRGNIAKRD